MRRNLSHMLNRPSPLLTGPVIYQEVICVSNAQPTLVPSLERIIQGRDGPLSSAHIGQHCILSVPNIDQNFGSGIRENAQTNKTGLCADTGMDYFCV